MGRRAADAHARVAGARNTYQCVFARLPETWPQTGCTGVKASTSRVLTCVSFHLNTNTPSGFRTRKHSRNPPAMSARQSSESLPYFAASHDFLPARTKCGGSKMTHGNVASGKGSARKSICTSGEICSVRVPSARPCERSVTVMVSCRTSPNRTSLDCSGQNKTCGCRSRGQGCAGLASLFLPRPNPPPGSNGYAWLRTRSAPPSG